MYRREVGHSSMLRIVRNIRENMEFLELPGCGTHQPSSETRGPGRDAPKNPGHSQPDPGFSPGFTPIPGFSRVALLCVACVASPDSG